MQKEVKNRIPTEVKELREGYLNADVNGSANILVKFLTSNGQLQHPVVANRYGCVSHPKRLRLGDLVA